MEVESLEVTPVFLSCGCNRTVKAASWGPCNLVAFGAHNAVAIFCPQRAQIIQTLPGHRDLVNCVEWLPNNHANPEDAFRLESQYLLSGSADGIIILWAYHLMEHKWRKVLQLPHPHEKAISCISAVMVSTHEAVLTSSSSDCSVHIWNVQFPLEAHGECKVDFLQNIPTGSRRVVAVSLTLLTCSTRNCLLAMGGLDHNIHLFCGERYGQFRAACILKGHQDWIRSLDFSHTVMDGDRKVIYLASSGQDKTIRIWKIGPKSHTNKIVEKNGSSDQGFSIKMYIEGPTFKLGSVLWQVSVDSVLSGHDDWVYSVQWQPPSHDLIEASTGGTAMILQPMSILSASMDRTMMIWRPDIATGLWLNDVTVGELSHTALGFYGGCWSPIGDAILAHAFGGSFHLWKNVGKQVSNWQPQIVPSGHSSAVSDVAWAKSGLYLLSVSHDQTTRLYAPWNWSKAEKVNRGNSWHEIARPQIHGHDLNCLAMLKGTGNYRFVSGAEEKVARVFEAPASFLKTLENVEGYVGSESFQTDEIKVLGANLSALGLSQKPIYLSGGQATKNVKGLDSQSIEDIPHASPVVLTEPPLEEHLGWNTLWPETHKLYGHGNELFSMCCDHQGSILATACKAQSSNAAEIWLWEIGSWKAVGQLFSHTLTVTQMEFSYDDNFILSVSRDRHLSLFKLIRNKDSRPEYVLVDKVEAHKRIIWTCSWSPCGAFFATGSRDKTVKLWALQDKEGAPVCRAVEVLPAFRHSVTALAWAPRRFGNAYLLAIGLEDGCLEIWKEEPIFMAGNIKRFKNCMIHQVCPFSSHVASIHRLTWNKNSGHSCHEEGSAQIEDMELASCGADHSVRLFNVRKTRIVG